MADNLAIPVICFIVIPIFMHLLTGLWELTVVLDYYEAMKTYSRIGLLRSYGNLQSYWTTTKLWKLAVVLDYYEAMETYSRILRLPISCTFAYLAVLAEGGDGTERTCGACIRQ
jgi:hypothetical protein